MEASEKKTSKKYSLTKTELSEDVIEKCIGGMGKWQIRLILVVSLVKLPVAWFQLGIIFLAPSVAFECSNKSFDKCSIDCPSHEFDTSIFASTITTEWDLVCGRQFLESITQTIAMLGFSFGSVVFGYLSDKYGRRSQLLLTTIIQGVFGLAAAFTTSLILFVILRFVALFATGGAMVISFVIVMEVLGIKWRTRMAILFQGTFSVGHLMMPLFSYFLRNWRHFEMAVSAPLFLLLVLIYFLVPESPRWEIAAGKNAEAVATLENIAKINGLENCHIKETVTSFTNSKKLKDVPKVSIKKICSTRILVVYTLLLWLNWLTTGMSFYGSNQYIGYLGGDIFLNVAISAMVQIPGVFIALYFINTWGRRSALFLGNAVAGISLVATALVPADPFWIKTMLASIGTLGLIQSFSANYIYAGEIFPTMVRNQGVGSCSVFGRIGSMVAPFIANLVTVVAWVPPMVFGVAMLLGAVVCYWLPETKNCDLPETIEEVENFKRKSVLGNK